MTADAKRELRVQLGATPPKGLEPEVELLPEPARARVQAALAAR
jgi:hypothetical protein